MVTDYTYSHRITTWVALTIEGDAVIAESDKGAQYRLFVKQLKEMGFKPDELLVTTRVYAAMQWPRTMAAWDSPVTT